MAPLDIRSARPDEYDGILALWRDAAEVASSTDDLAGLSALHAADPDALLVAVEDDTLVGTLIVGWDGWRGAYYRLVVDPSHRRRGVARALVAAGERRLSGLGCRRVSLFAVAAHPAAAAFWPAAGYHPDPEEVRFVANLDSRGRQHPRPH